MINFSVFNLIGSSIPQPHQKNLKNVNLVSIFCLAGNNFFFFFPSPSTHHYRHFYTSYFAFVFALSRVRVTTTTTTFLLFPSPAPPPFVCYCTTISCCCCHCLQQGIRRMQKNAQVIRQQTARELRANTPINVLFKIRTEINFLMTPKPRGPHLREGTRSPR